MFINSKTWDISTVKDADVNLVSSLLKKMAALKTFKSEKFQWKADDNSEKWDISGKKLTDFYSEEAKNRSDNKNTQPFNLHFFGIQPEARTVLHKAIKDRFNEMLDRGFVAEVERLYTRGDLDEALPAVKSVGYRQIWRYLSGQVDYEQMSQQAVIATRQLAKRQCTWLRNWEGLLEVKDCSNKTRDTILNYVETTSI